jgi:hypothetical protein
MGRLRQSDWPIEKKHKWTKPCKFGLEGVDNNFNLHRREAAPPPVHIQVMGASGSSRTVPARGPQHM